MDYDGVIGVPITSLKYLWDDGSLHVEINGATTQFEIVGLTSSSRECTYGQIIGNATTRAMIGGKKIYARILIRKK